MSTLTITRARYAPAPIPVAKHPTAQLKAGNRVLSLPYAPRGAALGGWAAPWSTLERPGRKPAVVRDGDNLATLNLTVYLGHADHQQTVEGYLTTLRNIAKAGDRIILAGLSPNERGPWRLEDVSVDASLRQQGTNHITRATVSLSFVEAVDPNPRLGPVKGGKKRKKGIKKATTHVVKKGDTLRKLANRYYGEPNEWRRIAKANKIKDPTKLKVGRKLRIPPDDKKD